MPKSAVNLMTMMNDFDTDLECRDYLERLRWPNGVECPRCKGKTISRILKRNQFDCDSCRYQFSATSGTSFHDSHLPLTKWFMAIYLLSESKKGMSANQLKRILNVSYKTAWYLCHRIRAAVRDDYCVPLTGTVEVDETYVGGKRRHVGRGYKGNKTMVLAAVQRGGEIRMSVDKRPSRKVLHKFVQQTTASDTRNVYRDENPAYLGIEDQDTNHETVNHSADEWVRGDVHTNSAEGVFSLFKRSIVGSYHQVSAKHLDAYLDEFEFRFNNRKNSYLFRDTLQRLIKAEAVPYEKLTA